MPTLPVYNAQNNIRPTTGEPLRNEAGAPFEMAREVVSTMQTVAQKWSDANDVMQYTEAKAKYELAVADIEMRANADPDFRKAPDYIAELAKAKETALSTVTSPQVTNKASFEFDYGNQLSGMKIGGQFKTKQLEQNKVLLKGSIDGLMKKKLTANTEAEAQQYDTEIQSLLSSNANTGTISWEEARKMLEDSQKTTVLYEIYNDPSTTESGSKLLAELKDPNGKYSYLDADTRLKMIEESQRRIFQNNQTFKREAEISKNERFNNIFQKANEGTLTFNDLDAEMEASINNVPGAMDQKEILEIRKGLTSRVKTDLELVAKSNPDARKYIQFVNNFISDETDRQKGREAIAKSFKDGVLSPNEAVLLNGLLRSTEDIRAVKDREAFMGKRLIPFKNAINAINDFFTGKKNYTEADKALVIKKLLGRIDVAQNPQDMVKDILREYTVEKNPSILRIPEEGQIFMDDNGSIRMMYPDSRYKEMGAE